RHTRCYRDWSSDVCSSDLSRPWPFPVLGWGCCVCDACQATIQPKKVPASGNDKQRRVTRSRRPPPPPPPPPRCFVIGSTCNLQRGGRDACLVSGNEIGRESCREGMEMWGIGGTYRIRRDTVVGDNR